MLYRNADWGVSKYASSVFCQLGKTADGFRLFSIGLDASAIVNSGVRRDGGEIDTQSRKRGSKGVAKGLHTYICSVCRKVQGYIQPAQQGNPKAPVRGGRPYLGWHFATASHAHAGKYPTQCVRRLPVKVWCQD